MHDFAFKSLLVTPQCEESIGRPARCPLETQDNSLRRLSSLAFTLSGNLHGSTAEPAFSHYTPELPKPASLVLWGACLTAYPLLRSRGCVLR